MWESRGFRQKEKAGEKKEKSRNYKSGGNRIRVGTIWESNEKPIYPLGNGRVCYLLLLAWGMQTWRPAPYRDGGRQQVARIFIRAKANVHHLNSKTE